jgi:quercetin dioxygenase-like cupin family protein
VTETPRTGTRYAWAEIEPDFPVPKASRRLVKGERMMAARFELEEGLDVPPHAHHNEQITIVLEGRVLVRIGSTDSEELREEVLGPGEVVALPPFVPHGFKALERTLAIDLFSPVSDKTGIDQS